MRTKDRLAEFPDSALHQFADDSGETRLTSKRVYEAALDDDPLALAIIDDTAFWLGIGITSLVHTMDPGSVVLGGAMNFGGAECPVGKRFLDRIRDEFRKRTFPNVFEGTTLSFASLGSDAGYLGAAGYARKKSGL